MEKNLFGYLVVTPNTEDYAIIAKDYWHSTFHMNKKNKNEKSNYRCVVILFRENWWKKWKLSKQTGIPVKRIYCLQKEKDIANFMAADSFVDDSYCGNTRVYDQKENIAQTAFVCASNLVFGL